MIETANLLLGCLIGALAMAWVLLPQLRELETLKTEKLIRQDTEREEQAKSPVEVIEAEPETELPRFGLAQARIFRSEDYEEAPPACNRGEQLDEGGLYYVVEVLNHGGGEIIVCPKHMPFLEEVQNARAVSSHD